MLNNASGYKKIYIACGYTDLRQGIDGLAATIRQTLEIDPFQKNVLFMFCGRKPDKIKCLEWEGDGFVLVYKRLLDGRYQWPRTRDEVMDMTQEQFDWLIPDNLKTGVIKNTRYETVLNRSYQELAEYYDTAIVPARVEHPRDKSHAEGTVRFASTWILAARPCQPDCVNISKTKS